MSAGGASHESYPVNQQVIGGVREARRARKKVVHGFDVDGTFADVGELPEQPMIEAVNRAVAQGDIFVFNTGRPEKYLNRIRSCFSRQVQETCPWAADQGLVYYVPGQGRFENTMADTSAEQAAAVNLAATIDGVHIHIEHADGFGLGYENPTAAKIVRQFVEAKIAERPTELKRSSVPGYDNINTKWLNKRIVLQTILAKLGLSTANCVVIVAGDGETDYPPMLADFTDFVVFIGDQPLHMTESWNRYLGEELQCEDGTCRAPEFALQAWVADVDNFVEYFKALIVQ